MPRPALAPLLAPLVLALALATPAAAADDDAMPATLSVTGHGSASAAPDIATIRLGVETQAEQPAAAMDDNTAAVQRIVERIRAAGIAESDIQTANFSIYPVYDQRQMQQEGGAPVVVGFRVANEVVARIRNLDGMGAVLSGVVEAGANRIDALSFGIDDPTPLEDHARREAMADARHTAELYAEAAGVRLVRILSLSDSAAARPPMPMDGRMMRMEAAAADVPIQRGENTVEATVSVVWEIAPAE